MGGYWLICDQEPHHGYTHPRHYHRLWQLAAYAAELGANNVGYVGLGLVRVE